VTVLVGTHSGTFHADDVLAFALIRNYYAPGAEVVRSRDPSVLDRCDIVIDVGGVYDPDILRFDHHQGSYQGPLSSAGMILQWLGDTERIPGGLATELAETLVDYVDAVDTGRQAPDRTVPCFALLVERYGAGAKTPEDRQEAFLEATAVAQRLVQGIDSAWTEEQAARNVVKKAMEAAVDAGRTVIILDQYRPWKPPYFELGGAEHPTQFVMFESEDGTAKVVAIPPRLGCFEQKQSFPESWGGKMGEELSRAVGMDGAIFCHKNRFIAVFQSPAIAERAMRAFDLWEIKA